jgi:hypothetical protein
MCIKGSQIRQHTLGLPRSSKISFFLIVIRFAAMYRTLNTQFKLSENIQYRFKAGAAIERHELSQADTTLSFDVNLIKFNRRHTKINSF